MGGVGVVVNAVMMRSRPVPREAFSMMRSPRLRREAMICALGGEASGKCSKGIEERCLAAWSVRGPTKRMRSKQLALAMASPISLWRVGALDPSSSMSPKIRTRRDEVEVAKTSA